MRWFGKWAEFRNMSLIHTRKGHVPNSVHHITNAVIYISNYLRNNMIFYSCWPSVGDVLACHAALKLCRVVTVLFLDVQRVKSTKFLCFEYRS